MTNTSMHGNVYFARCHSLYYTVPARVAFAAAVATTAATALWGPSRVCLFSRTASTHVELSAAVFLTSAAPSSPSSRSESNAHARCCTRRRPCSPIAAPAVARGLAWGLSPSGKLEVTGALRLLVPPGAVTRKPKAEGLVTASTTQNATNGQHGCLARLWPSVFMSTCCVQRTTQLDSGGLLQLGGTRGRLGAPRIQEFITHEGAYETVKGNIEQKESLTF